MEVFSQGKEGKDTLGRRAWLISQLCNQQNYMEPVIKLEQQSENPKKKNRERRERDILTQKKDELLGLWAFSEHSPVFELKKKKESGTITEEEQEKLDRLAGWGLEDFSRETLEMFKSLEEGDPNVEKVGRDNDGKIIEVSPEDKQEKKIFTDGLGGCFLVLVFSEHSSGRRQAILTHYFQGSVAENILKLKELCVSVKQADYKQCIFLQAENNHEKRKKYTDELEAALKDILGEELKIEKGLYPIKNSPEVKDKGIFAVTIPPKDAPYYKAWFDQEKRKLGKGADKEK